MKILIDNEGYIVSYCNLGDIEGSIDMNIDNIDFDKLNYYKLYNGSIIFDEDKYNNSLYENHINELRTIRDLLLIAFDKYKINVFYGIINESSQQKNEILKWYQLILDMDEYSILNPIKEISYYM